MNALDGTMGAVLLGVLFSGVLWGVILIQTWHYFTHYGSDSVRLKLLVATVFVTETIHQALITHTIYAYLITHFANKDALDHIERTLVIEVFFEVVTAVLVQSFFVVRIWRLGGQRLILTVPIIILIVAEFVVTTVYSVEALSLTSLADLKQIEPYAISMNASAAATDVAIAAIMCSILQMSKTGFPKSNHLINRLITFSINTGLMTSTCACISLITNLTMPHSFVYMAFFFVIGRLYANSLLVTLNARKRLRDDLDVSINLSTQQLWGMPAGAVKASVLPAGDVHPDVEFNTGSSSGSSEAGGDWLDSGRRSIEGTGRDVEEV